ncbi:MAG: maleylpyruvate isomerase family mycothiol-dependent enzyme, partial [Acidimicrobiia bacterium]|nr:maleylpyruvate isomerase family mycothiol-dependent enzyme [Acidimicrobiia bacterium]
MPTFTLEQLIDAFDDVLAATEALARPLSEADGDRPTDCPGWTVKDQVAHMAGLEQIIGGAPAPEIELPELAHVHGDTGRFMELSVHVRRGLPLVAVVDELAGMRPRRVAELRSLTAGGVDPLVPTPFGERPLSAGLPVRVFDLWAHEQDIRRALGQPPRITGLGAAVSLDRVLAMWPRGLPQAVKGVDGELAIEVTGPEPST